MNAKILRNLSFVALIIFTLACGLPGSQDAVETEPTPQEISTVIPPTEASINHETIPISLPGLESGQAADFDSSIIPGSDYFIGGDRFTYGRLERPFNTQSMDVYYPEIDIVHTMVLQDDTWIYGLIVLNDVASTKLSEKRYGIELDTDLNGKGDFLILATLPTSSDWTVDGVQIFKDENGDVGGESPYFTDEVIAPGDGFEKKIFDSGEGDDTDAAWVRLSADNENTIEFSIKKTAVGEPGAFLINMWAGTNLLDPALFDINDHFTHEEAGAADKGLEYFYPIKAVSEIDNSCRMAVGFQPTGQEPGLCPTASQQAGSEPGAPGGSGKPGIIIRIFCIPSSCPADSFWDDGSCSCKPIK